MDKSEFREGILGLYEYFRIQNPPSTKVILSMYHYVATIPGDKFNTILDKLKAEHDNLPRNIPKVIKGIYFSMPQLNKQIQYDKFEDLRYPIENLNEAFAIICEQGKEDFRAYCNKTRMPQQDRERVYNKWRYHNDPEFRDKIKGIIKNIQQKLDGSDLSLSEIPF